MQVTPQLSRVKSNVALLILLATTFLPVSERFNLIKLLTIFLLCFYVPKPKYRTWFDKEGKGIIALWLISAIIASLGVLFVEGIFNQSWTFHEFSRILYYGLVMFLCSRIQIDLRFLFFCCCIVLGIHFTIQLTQYLKLGTFNHLIETYYISEEDIGKSHYQQAVSPYYSFRSGSIFINPNVYVCYPYLTLAVILEYYRQTRQLWPLLMIVVAFLSVVFTGSRMGMLAFIIITIWFFKFIGRNKRKRKTNNIGTFIFILALVIVGIFFGEELINSMDDFRAFELESAYQSSGETKVSGFLIYLQYCNPFYWLTGSLGSKALNIQIDMEFGYIIAWFGILGIIWYSRLIKGIYRNNLQQFRVLSTIATLGILVTAIGASSVLNMSVFPYICAIALTNLSFKKFS